MLYWIYADNVHSFAHMEQNRTIWLNGEGLKGLRPATLLCDCRKTRSDFQENMKKKKGAVCSYMTSFWMMVGWEGWKRWKQLEWNEERERDGNGSWSQNYDNWRGQNLDDEDSCSMMIIIYVRHSSSYGWRGIESARSSSYAGRTSSLTLAAHDRWAQDGPDERALV